MHSISECVCIILLRLFFGQVQNNDISTWFFHFFKILVVWVVRLGGERRKECKGQKLTQNDKTNLPHSVSQQLYLIWLWFFVQLCKIMISSAIFFRFFKVLIFRVFQDSSINAKRKFWGVPYLDMCVIFFFCIFIQPFQKFHLQYHVPYQLAKKLHSHLPNLIPNVSFSYS